MKSLKNGIILLTIVFLTQRIKLIDVFCHKDLMKTYGMVGNDKPRKMIIEMCPNVQLSCCRKDDQLQIYGSWVSAKEDKDVDLHYKNMIRNYDRMFLLLEGADKLSLDILKRQKAKQIGNCKAMAERIKSFQIKNTIKHIQASILKVNEFFNVTYSGFYCTICDAVNHMFFEPSQKKIIYSERFCRDITENTLTSLLYFHTSMTIMGNLISTLVNSCNHIGDYAVLEPIPKDVIFKVDEKINNELNKCKLYRNDKSWYVYCRPVCENFKLTTFPDFFEGQHKTLEKWILFIEQKLKDILVQSKQPQLGESSKSRILEAFSSSKKKDEDMQKIAKEHKTKNAIKFNNRILQNQSKEKKVNIFNEIPEGTMKLASYKSQFRKEGLSPYVVGKSSVINVIMFNQVKRLINQQKEQGVDPAVMNSFGASYASTPLFTKIFVLFIAFALF